MRIIKWIYYYGKTNVKENNISLHSQFKIMSLYCSL